MSCKTCKHWSAFTPQQEYLSDEVRGGKTYGHCSRYGDGSPDNPGEPYTWDCSGYQSGFNTPEDWTCSLEER